MYVALTHVKTGTDGGLLLFAVRTDRQTAAFSCGSVRWTDKLTYPVGQSGRARGCCLSRPRISAKLGREGWEAAAAAAAGEDLHESSSRSIVVVPIYLYSFRRLVAWWLTEIGSNLGLQVAFEYQSPEWKQHFSFKIDK